MLEPKHAPPQLTEVTDLSGILFKYHPGQSPGIHIPWEAIGTKSGNGPNGSYIFTALRLLNTPDQPFGRNAYMVPNPPVSEEDLIARPFCIIATPESEQRKLFWVPEMILVTYVDIETGDNNEFLKIIYNPNLMSIWEQRAAFVLTQSGLVKNVKRARKVHYASRNDRANNRRLYSSHGNSPERRFFTSMGYYIFEEV